MPLHPYTPIRADLRTTDRKPLTSNHNPAAPTYPSRTSIEQSQTMLCPKCVRILQNRCQTWTLFRSYPQP